MVEYTYSIREPHPGLVVVVDAKGDEPYDRSRRIVVGHEHHGVVLGLLGHEVRDPALHVGRLEVQEHGLVESACETDEPIGVQLDRLLEQRSRCLQFQEALVASLHCVVGGRRPDDDLEAPSRLRPRTLERERHQPELNVRRRGSSTALLLGGLASASIDAYEERPFNVVRTGSAKNARRRLTKI